MNLRTKGQKIMKKGIDVSDNNGKINWQAIADYNDTKCDDDKIKFAIVASSFGRSGRHDRFAENVEGAHSIGLQCGAYHYSYAIDSSHPAIEAENCRNAINESGVLLELPVFYDMEDADKWKANKGWYPANNDVTSYCRDFINNLGLDCGIYASYSWLQSYIDWRSLGCAVWNAQWGNNDDLKGYMWQYTDKLYIPGASRTELFDANILYL